MRNRVHIIAVYFGTLPEYFQVWLHGCKNNPDYTWHLVTDANCSGFDFPLNVEVHRSNLSEVRQMFSATAGIDVALTTPYKLCDFKVLFWALLSRFKISCDFWGHCDIDLVFGRLNGFITDKILDSVEKVFSFGHLSLYRNDYLVNRCYRLSGSKFIWKDVFSSKTNVGFDEEYGINSIWASHGLRLYKGRHVVADILPQFTSLVLDDILLNRPGQVFYLRNGQVLRGYWTIFGKWKTHEFAYIHFQKRRISIVSEIVSSQGTYRLTTNAFQQMNVWPPAKTTLLASVARLTASDAGNLFRLIARKVRRKAQLFARMLDPL